MERFWFKTEVGLGFGVTAHSLEDAHALVSAAASEIGIRYKVVEILANVDIQTLDQGHVIPNMGSPSFRGVWYPMLNLRPGNA